MKDLATLERVARSNGYWHHIEPFAARLAEAERELAEFRQCKHPVSMGWADTTGRYRSVCQSCGEVIYDNSATETVSASSADAITCWCHKCHEGHTVHGFTYSSTVMILCPDCGNKRCPKATDHRHACTGSNEPGQPGSVYGTSVTVTGGE
jgi:hypothetical protein